jgi:hypothetical protein
MSCRETFPFGLLPSSDAHARQAAKSFQIQSGHRESLDVPCTYHKSTRHTLRGYRLRKKINQESSAPRST